MSGQRYVYFLALSGAIGALGVTGCSVVVGAGDYKVGSTDGGSAGDVVTIHDASTDHASQDGGRDSGMDAGDSGGDEPTSGGCGSTPLPSTDPAFQAAVTTCALAVGCDPYLFQDTMSDCISTDYLHSIGSQACLTTISDCAGYQSCTGLAIPTKAQCATSSTTAYCGTGSYAINCGADSLQGSYVQSCSPVQCGTYDDTGATAAGCIVEQSCPASQDGDGYQHCSTSNNLYTCIGGKGYGQPCGSGSTCKEDTADPTSTNCFFNGTACTTPGYTCNGNTLEWCTSGNVLFNLNCATAGLTCAIDDITGNGYCVAPGCTTTDYTNCVESCGSDGHTANLCIGGVSYSIDCADPTYGGFKTCYDTFGSGVYCQ
jgi:hypothetical protein